jgi:hypothetical protein
MSEALIDKKRRVLRAAEKGVDELIKVLEEPIVTHGEEDLSADKMKNAASAKRLAFEDAMSMIEQIEKEQLRIDEIGKESGPSFSGVEGRAKKSGNGK